MEKVSLQDALRRAFAMCFASLFGCLGTVVFYISGAGAMPMSALQQAINVKTGLSFTALNWGINLIFLAYFFLRDRRFIHVGTLVALAVPGPITDFYNFILRDFYQMDFGWAGYFLIPLLGACIMGIGQSIWYPAAIGIGPSDMPLMALQLKGWSFQKAYFLMQGIWMVLALLVGGVFGWGTLVGFCFQGPISGFFMRFTKAPVYRLCHRYDQMAKEGMISEEEGARLMAEHKAVQEKKSA